MADGQTEEARLARYEKCRRQVRFAEFILNIAMFTALVLAAGELFPQLLVNFLGTVTLSRGWDALLALLLTIADAAAAVYVIHKRKWIFTLGVLILTLGLIGAGYISYWGLLLPIPLAAALIAHLILLPLQNEEGYPHFTIEHEDRAAHEKAIVQSIVRRAVESNVRTVPDGQPGEMHDLLDEQTVQALPAELKAYKDRSQAAAPAVKPAGMHSGTMDEL